MITHIKREVLLVHVGKKQQDVLRYRVPSLPIAFKGKVSVEGYPDAVAEVEMYRLPERCDDPPSDPYRPNGLLITGRRAIYENTLFKYEVNPHAGWFCGRVRCTYIDTLAADYDSRLEKGEEQLANNPIPIITRRRDGLQSSHPFAKALAKAIEKPLGDLVAEEARKASHEGVRTSISLRKNLDALGRDLARLIDEELRESELEGLVGAGPIGAGFPAIKLIPPNVVIYAGEEKTVTVVVRADTKAAEATCSLDPEGVVEVMKESTIKLEPHRRRPELLVGRFILRPLGDPGECLITVAAGNDKEVGEVEVRPAREIVEVELEQPDSLKFERDSYRVTWMKKKRLRLLAPLELIAKEGPEVRVTSDSSGIVVLGQDLTFELNEEGEYYFVDAIIEARELGATATVRAKCGNQESISKVTVVRDADGPELRIVPVNEEGGFRRAIVEQDGQATVIKIMGLHPSLKRYLGPPPEFPDQDEPITRAVIAEIVADEAARMVMERKFTASAGSGFSDAANFYVEHLKLLSKYLARCHEHLVEDRPRSLLSEEPAAEVPALARAGEK